MYSFIQNCILCLVFFFSFITLTSITIDISGMKNIYRVFQPREDEFIGRNENYFEILLVKNFFVMEILYFEK